MIHRNSNFLCAFKIALCFWTRNYYKCILNIPELPYLLCAIASLNMQSIRRYVIARNFKPMFYGFLNYFRDMIQCFSVAYRNNVLYVSLDWMKNIMYFESVQQLISDLRYYGFKCDVQTKSVNFQSELFQSSKPIVNVFIAYTL